MAPSTTDLCATIAVLPFVASDRAPGQAALGEVLTDELIVALSSAPQLKVISRLSTVRLPRDGDYLDATRRLLGADYVLTGQFRALDNCIDVSGEIRDVANGDVVWSDRVRGRTSTLWQGESELINDLSRVAQSSVLRSETHRTRASGLGTLHAHSLLLGAIGLMHGPDRNDFERSGRALARLTEHHAAHALPHAWLAHWHVLKAVMGRTDDPAGELRLAADASRRAMDLQPDCALALTMDGFVRTHQHDLDGALKQFEQALHANPSEPMGWLLKGALHAFRGEGDAAVAATGQARSLSPLDPLRYFYDSLSATAGFSAGRYDEALAFAQQSASANPLNTSTLRVLAACHVQLGHPEQARDVVTRLRRLDPRLTVRRYIAQHPAAHSEAGRLVAGCLQQAGLPY